MKKTLKKPPRTGVYYFIGGQKVFGLPPTVSGKISSDLRGDVSDLRGNISGMSGDITGLYGDITGLYGDATGLIGNVDDCELTDDDRKASVDVNDLISD